jgi:hypothetical protein
MSPLRGQRWIKPEVDFADQLLVRSRGAERPPVQDQLAPLDAQPYDARVGRRSDERKIAAATRILCIPAPHTVTRAIASTVFDARDRKARRETAFTTKSAKVTKDSYAAAVASHLRARGLCVQNVVVGLSSSCVFVVFVSSWLT